MVATAVLFLFIGGISVVVDASMRVVGTARAKYIGATFAQKKIELARNLPYDDVGTVGGIPPGLLPQQESIQVGALNYDVRVTVYYVDDPYDGVAPTDLLPVDYKRVKVAVTWDGPFASNSPLELWTDISPKGVETLAGAGTLSLQVFDSLGAPVVGADVLIVNDQVTPAVNLSTLSDSSGRVLLPGALACVECYEVTVSKDGFTTDRTYGTDEVDIPNKPHISVIEGEVSEASFAIDKTSTIHYKTVRTAEYNYAPINSVQMHVYGSKLIGTTALGEPVYAYDQMIVTQPPNGEIYVGNMAWDQYTVEIPLGSAVEEAGTSPLVPFALSPGQELTFYMVVAAST
ncbi:MAG: carboxypeptidase regulatory-like domain-containing protein, partial [Gammaproteobacteria bacterium]